MDERIEFARNYSDRSTNQGFQFEFFCNRCGTGYRTHLKPSLASTLTGAMDAASSLFGGIFGKAADLSERVRSASWEKAHDDAFAEAMEELRPAFIQCPHCSTWVCRKSCWNAHRGELASRRSCDLPEVRGRPGCESEVLPGVRDEDRDRGSLHGVWGEAPSRSEVLC